jgi:hypothetical protein
MKASFLLVPLLLLSLSSHAQQPFRPFAALSQQLSLQRASFRLGVSPQFGLQYKRHQGAVGPLVVLAEFPKLGPNKPVLSGGLLQYRYQLSKEEHKRFYLFAEFSSKLQIFNERWTANYWQESSQTYQEYLLGSHEISWTNLAGLGAGLAPTAKLRLMASMAIGYTHSDIRPTETSPYEPWAVYDYRGYDNSSLTYAFGLSACYFLIPNKAK